VVEGEPITVPHKPAGEDFAGGHDSEFGQLL
jgi:hypothetical protein